MSIKGIEPAKGKRVASLVINEDGSFSTELENMESCRQVLINKGLGVLKRDIKAAKRKHSHELRKVAAKEQKEREAKQAELDALAEQADRKGRVVKRAVQLGMDPAEALAREFPDEKSEKKEASKTSTKPKEGVSSNVGTTAKGTKAK